MRVIDESSCVAILVESQIFSGILINSASSHGAGKQKGRHLCRPRWCNAFGL